MLSMDSYGTSLGENTYGFGGRQQQNRQPATQRQFGRPQGPGSQSAGIPLFDPRTNTSAWGGGADYYAPSTPPRTQQDGQYREAPVVMRHSLGGQPKGQDMSAYSTPGQRSPVDVGAYRPQQNVASYQPAQYTSPKPKQAYSPSQAQPVQPPSQGAPYAPSSPARPAGSQASPELERQIRDQYSSNGMDANDPRFRQFQDWYFRTQTQGRSPAELDRVYSLPAQADAWRNYQGQSAPSVEPVASTAPRSAQARPIEPPGQGTPYEPQGFLGNTAGMPLFDPRTMTSSHRGSDPGTPPVVMRHTLGGQMPTQSISGDERGSLAGQPSQLRPAPFQVNPSQTPWGQSADPFTERQAVIEQLNQQRMQRQMDFNRTAQQPGMPSWWGSAPQSLNYGGAISAAGLGQGSPSLGRQGTWMDTMNQQFGNATPSLAPPPLNGGYDRPMPEAPFPRAMPDTWQQPNGYDKSGQPYWLSGAAVPDGMGGYTVSRANRPPPPGAMY